MAHSSSVNLCTNARADFSPRIISQHRTPIQCRRRSGLSPTTSSSGQSRGTPCSGHPTSGKTAARTSGPLSRQLPHDDGAQPRRALLLHPSRQLRAFMLKINVSSLEYDKKPQMSSTHLKAYREMRPRLPRNAEPFRRPPLGPAPALSTRPVGSFAQIYANLSGVHKIQGGPSVGVRSHSHPTALLLWGLVALVQRYCMSKAVKTASIACRRSSKSTPIPGWEKSQK